MLPLLLIALLSASPLQAAVRNRPAPAFSLMNSKQETRSLASYRGKVVVINFWASWCAPCQAELPMLNRLAADYKRRNVRVLAINVDTDRNAGRRALARLGLTASHLEVLWDTRARVVDAYAIETMPSSFVLDSSGKIRFIHAGYHPSDPSRWRKEIESLLD